MKACACVCVHVYLYMKKENFHLVTTRVKPQQLKLITPTMEVSEQHELQNIYKCSLFPNHIII